MKSNKIITTILSTIISFTLFSQPVITGAKGTLFIIGGGSRSNELMSTLISTAKLEKTDYIVILPMSSAYTDTAFYYIKDDFKQVSSNLIVNFNFTKDNVNDAKWIDSLKHAKLIFITGGDQSRFMGIVLNTPVVDAIHYAYKHGATIAGTSAGAAVMSKKMITGKELSDLSGNSTFKKVHSGNTELKAGLGLLESVVIDQHFIVRSRYNRLISVLADFPTYTCIGIDEETAIIVEGKKITVSGKSQVVVLSDPKNLQIKKGLIKINEMRFSLYTNGDTFKIR